jgi:hypothetical protein
VVRGDGGRPGRPPPPGRASALRRSRRARLWRLGRSRAGLEIAREFGNFCPAQRRARRTEIPKFARRRAVRGRARRREFGDF